MLIRQLKNTVSEDFEACMRIYRDSFPAAERQPESVLAERINNGTASLYVCYDNAAPAGFALLYILRDCECTLLDYFALATGSRAKGLGSKMLKDIFSKFSPVGSDDKNGSKEQGYLVMEVEHPDFGDNKDQRKRRIRFYENAGALVLKSTRYLLPPLGGATAPAEMQLMIYPAPVAGLSTAMINNLIRQLYEQVYNRHPGDPLLDMLIR